MLGRGLARIRPWSPVTIERQCRGMSGLVRTNYYVEEFNGRRESAEKDFKFDRETNIHLLFAVVLFPIGVHYLSKKENASKFKKQGRQVDQL